MKRLLFPLLLLFGFVTAAQAQYVKVLSVAGQGGNTVLTSGITSTTKVEKTFPGATITVYSPTGSGTIASIFSASTGTVKANPFSASSTDATIDFFIAPGSTFDIRVSGVSGGVTITPFTRSGYTAPGTTGISLALCGGTADTSLLAALSALGGTIQIPKGITCASNSQTLSAALQVDNGGLLKPITGQTVTLTGAQIGGSWQRFTNATSGLGTISLSGNKHLYEIYSEWWGAIADGSTNCTGAINAAIASLTNNQPGVNGGIVRLGFGVYLVTGITITDQQAHIIGSGSGGAYGSTDVATTIVKSVSNAPIIKYAYSANIYSFHSRLEHLLVLGNNTGASQFGVWVDNGGILATDVKVTHTGAAGGWYLTHSNDGTYINIGAHYNTGDGIRLYAPGSAFGSAGTNKNVFISPRMTTNNRGFHFLSGHGNVLTGVDSEHNTNQGVYFDHDAGAPSEVTYNEVSLWSELDSGPCYETAANAQNNDVKLLRQCDVAPVINSTGIGNTSDSAAAYGQARVRTFGPIISAQNPGTLSLPSGAGFYLADGNWVFNNSTQKMCWSTTLPCISIASSTNFLLTNFDGTAAGSINLGPSNSAFTELMRNGTGMDIRNGDNTAYGNLTAKSVIVANTGVLRITPKTTDSYSSAMTIDATIGNHVIAASFTTSATVTMTPSAAGTAGDMMFITTEADASGTVTTTFAATFHSSGTQATTASHFSTITFQSDGTRWVELNRTTNLAFFRRRIQSPLLGYFV